MGKQDRVFCTANNITRLKIEKGEVHSVSPEELMEIGDVLRDIETSFPSSFELVAVCQKNIQTLNKKQEMIQQQRQKDKEMVEETLGKIISYSGYIAKNQELFEKYALMIQSRYRGWQVRSYLALIKESNKIQELEKAKDTAAENIESREKATALEEVAIKEAEQLKKEQEKIAEELEPKGIKELTIIVEEEKENGVKDEG